ncbi:MAG: hypothetical protein QXK37_05170 [Candidatus Woesearchaeota archaeon]
MKKIKARCCVCGKEFLQSYDERKEHVDEESMFVCDDSGCIAKFQRLEQAIE